MKAYIVAGREGRVIRIFACRSNQEAEALATRMVVAGFKNVRITSPG